LRAMSYEHFDRWRNERLVTEPDLSIVIPAYNERRRIVPTVASIAAHLAATPLTWELIVSDDGSTDGSPDHLRTLGMTNLRVVTSGVNEGKGAAVRRGLRAARGRAVLFADADCSTPIAELDPMLAELRAGADVVVGSRSIDGAATTNKSGLRHLLSTTLRLIVSILLPTGVRDTQCGFKLFGRDVAHQLADIQTITGFSFDLELLYLAKRHELTVVEHPVSWFDAPGSTVDPARESIRFLRDILRIRWRSLRGVYRRRRAGSAHSELLSSGASLHVAVVTPYPPSDKTLNEYGFHLVHALASKPEVTELTVLHDDLPDGLTPASTLPPGVRAIPAWRFGSVWNTLRLAATLRRERPDVVLFNIQFASFGNGRVSAALGLLSPVVGRLLGIRSIVLLHNLVDTVDLEQAGFARNRLVAVVYAAIGRVLTRVILAANEVAVTIPAYVGILEDRYGATNVYLAPHGVFEEATDDVSTPEGPQRLLTFGKFGTYKRVETLIEAYRLLLQAGHRDLELVVAGTDAANTPGYLAAVATANRDLPGLRFTGYVAEEDVEQTFRSSTLVVFPYTATTGSSGPLHQAGSYGRAAVLPAIGDLLELIHDEGFAGESFEPDDAMSMAGAIARLLDDDERRDDIARQNANAAAALPLTDVVDWHVVHLAALAAR
jgi:glycosyltransferase involved in cell wall biosynthesis